MAEPLYESIVEESNDGIFVAQEGDIVYANERIRELTGYSEEELLGSSKTMIVAPEDSDLVRSYHRARTAGDTAPNQYDIELQTSAGDRVPVELSVSRTEYDGAPASISFCRDITAQTIRERTLRQYEQAVEASDDLIVAVDAAGSYLFANSTYKEYYGVDTVEGKQVQEVVGESTFESSIRTRQESALAGQPVSYQRTEEFPDRGERTLAITYTPITADEQVIGLVAILRDVTEREESKRRLQTQRDNLELLNQIVRHDIRNDLQVVSTYAETLQNYVDEDGQTYLSKILEASHDAVEITETARDVTEIMLQSDSDPSPAGLRRVLEGEIDDVRSNYDQALVTVDGSIPGITVLADDMLESVFRNLLSNAVQHNDKEIPEVTVRATRADDSVTIEISDNGPGIPDSRKDDIFEEGEQGLDSGGTGLGLYLVDTLVERYGGEIHVEDNDPEGSIFVLTLLLAE